MNKLLIKRVYDAPEPGDGARVLVDRLWPRGLSKEQARIDYWLKDIAPTNELRKWYGHDESLWDEFKRCYFDELRTLDEPVTMLRKIMKGETITLLTAPVQKRTIMPSHWRNLSTEDKALPYNANQAFPTA